MARRKKADSDDPVKRFSRLKPRVLQSKLAKLDQFIAEFPAEYACLQEERARLLQLAGGEYETYRKLWQQTLDDVKQRMSKVSAVVSAMKNKIYER